MVHIVNFNPIKNGVYILVEVSIWIWTQFSSFRVCVDMNNFSNIILLYTNYTSFDLAYKIKTKVKYYFMGFFFA